MRTPRKRKRKVGRPSGYRYKHIAIAVKLAGEGKVDAEIAEALGISCSTFYQWKQDHPKLSECVDLAKQGWRSACTTEIERALAERAKGYSHPEEKVFCSEGAIVTHDTTRHYPPDTQAAKFWLTNRAPDEWKESSHVEHDVTPDFAAMLKAGRERAAQAQRSAQGSIKTKRAA